MPWMFVQLPLTDALVYPELLLRISGTSHSWGTPSIPDVATMIYDRDPRLGPPLIYSVRIIRVGYYRDVAIEEQHPAPSGSSSSSDEQGPPIRRYRTVGTQTLVSL